MRMQPRDLDRLGVPVTTEARLLFNLAWPLFESRIERYAWRLSDEHDEREDLVQEAMITLWKCDPSAFDFLDPDDVGYLRRAMLNRMRNAYRKKHPVAKVSDMPASHVRALVAQVEGR